MEGDQNGDEEEEVTKTSGRGVPTVQSQSLKASLPCLGYSFIRWLIPWEVRGGRSSLNWEGWVLMRENQMNLEVCLTRAASIRMFI